jgi:hypothetical protein
VTAPEAQAAAPSSTNAAPAPTTPIAPPSSSTAAKATASAPARPPGLAASPLAVKRFVVASAVESREPVVAERVSVSTRPVFAFAELENAGDY